MILSVSYTDACKSVCSGYFYHAVMQDRDKQLENARSNQIKTVVMLPYQKALQQKIDAHFPNGVFASVNTLLNKPPVTIPFFNEAEDTTQHAYPEYYGLQKIIVQSDNP